MELQFEAIERRRRNLRLIFMGIIILTLPFYCVGFGLWATAPAQRNPNRQTATITPIDQAVRTNTLMPTSAAIATMTARSPLAPTPGQFLPPVIIPTTRFNSPTPFSVFIPTSTTAPSLTPFPSDTPFIFPTSTPVPLLPTFTPQPTQPTNTEIPPLPTETPFVILPPTDTPGP